MEFKNLQSEISQLNYETEFSFLNWFYTNLVLNFNMQEQTQSNWCWAATSRSVSHFYSIFSPWSQCSIASAEQVQTCCMTPVPSPCNVSWYLDKALTRTNNLVSWAGNAISWTEVKAQLQSGLVIGARIGWSGGGGHFVCIRGVTGIGRSLYLHIDDPIYGKSVITYDQFASNYQGSGTWTHTYYTKKYFYKMWFTELNYPLELLKPIPEVRPLLKLHDKVIGENEVPEYTIPHYAYVIGLNEIAKDLQLPDKPGTLRVIEMSKQQPAALYEVGLNPEKPELVQMNVSERYFGQLNESLGKLEQLADSNKAPGELRFLKIPALNLEAFWLHYEDARNDLIVPLKKFDSDRLVGSEKGFGRDAFIATLQEMAAKLNTSDDMLGN